MYIRRTRTSISPRFRIQIFFLAKKSTERWKQYLVEETNPQNSNCSSTERRKLQLVNKPQSRSGFPDSAVPLLPCEKMFLNDVAMFCACRRTDPVRTFSPCTPPGADQGVCPPRMMIQPLKIFNFSVNFLTQFSPSWRLFFDAARG